MTVLLLCLLQSTVHARCSPALLICCAHALHFCCRATLSLCAVYIVQPKQSTAADSAQGICFIRCGYSLQKMV